MSAMVVTTTGVLFTVGIQVGVPDGSGGASLLLVAAVALAVAAVPIAAPGLRVVESVSRAATLSFGSGVSVAYVFGHLLPEVSAARDAALPANPGPLPPELPVFLVALGGFIGFYGLEQYVQRPHEPDPGQTSGDPGATDGDFWVHGGIFAAYNVLVGHLVVDIGTGHETGLLLFGIALGLHLLVTAHGLRDHHPTLYHRFGRWLLASGVVVGAVLGLAVEVPHVAVAAALSFLAGAIVLNVVMEELPSHRENRFWAFALGAVLYTGLLVAV